MRTLPVYLLAFLFFINVGCKKSETPELKKDVTDPSLLKGMVVLCDQSFNRFNNRQGMTVTLENANPSVSDVTDSMGKFSLKIDTALKAFTIVYSKPLYGTFKEYYTRSNDSLYVSNGDLSDNQQNRYLSKGNFSLPNLSQKSTVVVNSIQIGSIANGQLNINCEVLGAGFIQFFYQKNTPITSFASIPKSVKNMTGDFAVNNGSNNIQLYMNTFYGQSLGNMRSGDTVYIIAYGGSHFWNSYLDRTTNQFIMPNINLNGNVTPVFFVLP